MAVSYPDLISAIEADPAQKVQKTTGGLKCRCPVHEDEHPSCSVTRGDGDKVLAYCHVCKASVFNELREKYGFSKQKTQSSRRRVQSPPPTQSAQSIDFKNYERIHTYTDESGNDLFRVCVKRKPDGSKTCPQFRPDGEGGWLPGLDHNVRRVLYNLPFLQEAVATGERIYIVEGEYCADVLFKKFSLVSTTNPHGCGKWRDEYSGVLTGADCVLLPDNDEQGRGHMRAVARSLLGIAKRVRVLQLPDLPAKGDIVDWIEGGGTYERFMELIEHDAHDATDYLNLPRVLNADDFLAAQRPPLQFHIEGILPHCGKMTLSATSKFGKSFLAMEIGLAIAGGDCEFLGWQFGPSSSVLYVQGEIMDALLEKRLGWLLHTMPEAMNARRARENFTVQEITPRRADFSTKEGRTLAETILRIHRPAVLILDPLSAICPGLEENEAAQMGEILGYFADVALRFGCAVILVHHHGKSGVSRGSSVFEGWPESDVQCTYFDDQHSIAKVELRLRCAFNDGPVYWQMPGRDTPWFSVMPEDWSPDDAKAGRKARTLEESGTDAFLALRRLGDGQAHKSLVDEISTDKSISQRTARRRIKDAQSAGLISQKDGFYVLS